MRDLGALHLDDPNSGAARINDSDEITGISVAVDGPPSAFVWRNGQMTDLNTVVHGGAGDDDAGREVRKDAKSSFSPQAMRKLIGSGLFAGRLR